MIVCKCCDKELSKKVQRFCPGCGSIVKRRDGLWNDNKVKYKEKNVAKAIFDDVLAEPQPTYVYYTGTTTTTR